MNVHTTANFCSIVPQIVVESLAFTEVLKSRDDTAPVVLLAGAQIENIMFYKNIMLFRLLKDV